MLTPCCLVLLSGWTHTQERTALPPSSGVMLFLLPSWTGPQGGDVLSLGLACSWEWTPRGIHGHCTSYPTSNTSALQDSALSSKGATWRGQGTTGVSCSRRGFTLSMFFYSKNDQTLEGTPQGCGRGPNVKFSGCDWTFLDNPVYALFPMQVWTR